MKCKAATVSAAVFGLMGASAVALAQTGVDVVFSIDESGSMGGDIAAVQTNVNTIATGLPAGSHGAVVGYGNSGGASHAKNAPHVHAPLVDLGSNLAAFQAGVNALAATGSVEPGYDAVYQSATNALGLGFTGAPYCHVLITDEASNGDTSTQAQAITALQNAKGVFFGVAEAGAATSSFEPIATATGGQMFDLAAFKSDPKGVLNAVLGACKAAVGIAGRMTGGGKFAAETGGNVSHGFELQCAKDAKPNNLEVNWKGNKFHANSFDAITCSDNPNYKEGKPRAGFDTITGKGTGTLNGKVGATVEFTFSDRGEPGKDKDRATILIKNSSGQVVLSATESLNQGNHQAHAGK